MKMTQSTPRRLYITDTEINTEGATSWIVLVDRYGDLHHYLFDTEDLETYKRQRWEWVGYSLQSKGRGSRSFHRIIMGVPTQRQYVEHVNGDLLDNRKANLRIVNRQGRKAGGGKWFDDQGKPLGIHKVRPNGYEYWRACIGYGHRPGESKNFSVAKLGDFEACRQACEWRARKMEERGQFMDAPTVEIYRIATQYNGDEVSYVPFIGEPSLVV